MNLKSFFDKVNHDYLMHLVSQRIKDKPLLKLIRRYLQAGVMEGGVVSPSRQGTPQGGPLSPLLSNILLDELDKELERRGHRFVRYADDCSIYVGSRRAGECVLTSLTRFIEEELHLKVNRRKSGVRKASEMKLLGYSFYRSKDGWRLRVASKSLFRVKATLREVTRKTWPVSMDKRLERLAEVSRGWVNYFKFADARSHLRRMDQWVRSRLRYCIWTQWKRVRTRYKALRKLGAPHRNAYIWANTRKGGWHTAYRPQLRADGHHHQCKIASERVHELARVVLEWIMKVMNRRIPDRYVRWRERTGRELIPIFLLDIHIF